MQLHPQIPDGTPAILQLAECMIIATVMMLRFPLGFLVTALFSMRVSDSGDYDFSDN